MFAAFWPNLLLFALGQAAAWCYLRSGRTAIGIAGTAALWSLLDWWLLATYVFDLDVQGRWLPLTLLQLTAVMLVVTWSVARWRRRWSAAAKRRHERFAIGLRAYLRSDHALAATTFRELLRTDPWDVAAWIALGDVLARSGEVARSRRCYRRAAAVDVGRAFADLLTHHRRPPAA